MIAKIVPTPKGGGRFGNLGAYVAAGRRRAAGLGPEGQGAEWSRLGSYVLDQAHGGEKVAASWTRNLGSEDLAWAIKMVEATQALARPGTGGKEGKTLHIVVSFAPGERLDVDTMKEIEERLARRLGLEDHQRIGGIHHNTDCWHMHVAINKVHPETLRTVTPYQSRTRLRALCREIEQEHGLTRTRLTREAERHLSEGAARMEAHEGRESFATWARAKAPVPLLAARDAGQGWQGVHEAAARLGLEIKPRGAGLVVTPAGVAGYGIKASAIDRGLGIKTMTDRLGAYEPPQPGRALPAAEERYTNEPLQKGAAAKALSVAFERARAQALAERDAAFKAMQAEQGDYRARLDAWAAGERERIRRGPFAAFDPDKYGKLREVSAQRRKQMAEARESRRKAGEVIRARHQIPTWQSFLEQKAQEGDERALETLRERQVQAATMAETIVAAETAEQARHVVRMGMTRTVRRDGTVAYTLRDGGQVRDRAGNIEIPTESRAAATLALELAADRFGRSRLRVSGSADFKGWVAEAAARDGADVTFADPGMETLRQRIIEERHEARDLEDATQYVAQRRGLSAGISGIGYQAWSPAQAGAFTYEGRAPLRDGGHAALWRRGAEMVVQRETAQVRQDTQHLTPGDRAELGRDGRARGIDQDRGR